MNREILVPWSPAPRVPFYVEVVSLVDGHEGLEISIRGQERSPGPILLIRFKTFVAYRCIDERHRLRTWAEQPSGSFPSLVTVQNSRWIKWLEEESAGLLAGQSLTHFAILTEDDCIDIVAMTPPEAGWIGSQ